MDKLDLSVKIANVELKNPVITASGTCGYGYELKPYLDPNLLGAITLKGLSLKGTKGNPTPRIAETYGGLLNAIGLENPGLAEFIKTKREKIKELKVPVFANISGYAIDDFAQLAASLAKYPEIAGLEVNVSCPNIAGGGMAFGTSSEMIYRVTKEVKKNYSGLVILKLSPNVTDISEMAAAACEGGADALSLINTLLGMAIDIDKRKPVLANTFGGLSGPAIKPVALRMVYQVAQRVKVPIIGMGGIMSGRDALEFIIAGASAIAVGSATLVEARASINILNEIKEYMIEHKISRLADLVGTLDV